MRIRETFALDYRTAAFDKSTVMDAILELEEQLERGEIEAAAYLQKKRSLVRML
ncbi:hypothetical protein [Leucobacter sp. wl10]|uniref:hypothetical protein n=1 Tax=Leucobacter sp. wl10 TaxID=2304677 RepID=UPI0013C31307|nr:hypothetical protein [Leucobacter sp. wl10]